MRCARVLRVVWRQCVLHGAVQIIGRIRKRTHLGCQARDCLKVCDRLRLCLQPRQELLIIRQLDILVRGLRIEQTIQGLKRTDFALVGGGIT